MLNKAFRATAIPAHQLTQWNTKQKSNRIVLSNRAFDNKKLVNKVICQGESNCYFVYSTSSNDQCLVVNDFPALSDTPTDYSLCNTTGYSVTDLNTQNKIRDKVSRNLEQAQARATKKSGSWKDVQSSILHRINGENRCKEYAASTYYGGGTYNLNVGYYVNDQFIRCQ